jgi:PTS system fructose-specific IIC component
MKGMFIMKKIVAVTACPAGVAHTYMAAEGLKKAAKKYGCSIKVETDGASGVENRLTEEDIKEADAVILAIDTAVNVERFHDKTVIEISVGDAIRKADKIIEKIQRG